MTKELICVLNKVSENESLEEILEIEDYSERLDKFFWLCKKYTRKKFTKDELETFIFKCFISLFERIGSISKAKDFDMACVSGGKLDLTKFTAITLTLAVLTAIPNSQLNIAPPARALITDKISNFWRILGPADKALVTLPALILLPGLYKLVKWLWTPFVNDIVKPVYKWFTDTFIHNRKKLDENPVEFRRTALEFLKANIFAQDKAINKVVDIISGHIDMWRESQLTGKSCSSACVMTFIGDSGTGKTYCARLLSLLLFGQDMQPWQFITSSSVKSPPPPSNAPVVNVYNDLGWNRRTDTPAEEPQIDLSPADRLFNEESDIVRELKLNNNVIIVIDEIDKIHKNDPQDTILERLRDAKDTGKLRICLSNGEYEDIDVSRTTFICISNEFRECWGLPKKQLSEAHAAARTTVVRDKSLVNRFDVVEFENFTSKDYMTILEPLIERLKEAYTKIYNMALEFTDDFAEKVADVAEEKNKGVRGLEDFLVKLRGRLVDIRSLYGITESKNSTEETQKFTIDYDKLNDEFVTVDPLTDNSELPETKKIEELTEFSENNPQKNRAIAG